MVKISSENYSGISVHFFIVEYRNKCIRVGEAHQALVPEFHLPGRVKDDIREGVLVWSNNGSLSETERNQKIKAYCFILSIFNFPVINYEAFALEKHYTREQALGLLLWNKHNIQRARDHIPHYYPVQESWSPDDISLFEGKIVEILKKEKLIQNNCRSLQNS